MSALSQRQRLQFRAARAISLLPPRWQVRLSGKPPVTIDGQTLEPEIQLLLSLIERRGRPPYEQLSLPEARQEMRRGAQVGAGHPPAMDKVRDLHLSGATGPLRARHYLPAGRSESPPLIVFFHGGGFVLGDLESHDVPCRLVAKHAGAGVLSVDYRRAPEHPFPAPVEDACASLRWAFEHAEELGADPGKLAVAGDSAGANLAAVAAREAASRDGSNGPALRLQILIYPVTDFAERTRSHELFESGFLLIRQDMDWFSAHYAADADPADHRLSILRVPDVGGTPPTLVVTAGFDPLRDEGEAYAARLAEAGVPVMLRRFPGLIHGFLNLVGISRAAHDALVEIGGAARAMLAETPPPNHRLSAGGPDSDFTPAGAAGV